MYYMLQVYAPSASSVQIGLVLYCSTPCSSTQHTPNEAPTNARIISSKVANLIVCVYLRLMLLF